MRHCQLKSRSLGTGPYVSLGSDGLIKAFYPSFWFSLVNRRHLLSRLTDINTAFAQMAQNTHLSGRQTALASFFRYLVFSFQPQQSWNHISEHFSSTPRPISNYSVALTRPLLFWNSSLAHCWCAIALATTAASTLTPIRLRHQAAVWAIDWRLSERGLVIKEMMRRLLTRLCLWKSDRRGGFVGFSWILVLTWW